MNKLVSITLIMTASTLGVVFKSRGWIDTISIHTLMFACGMLAGRLLRR